MGAGPLCKSQHNYTCNSVAHSHQNLPGTDTSLLLLQRISNSGSTKLLKIPCSWPRRCGYCSPRYNLSRGVKAEGRGRNYTLPPVNYRYIYLLKVLFSSPLKYFNNQFKSLELHLQQNQKERCLFSASRSKWLMLKIVLK